MGFGAIFAFIFATVMIAAMVLGIRKLAGKENPWFVVIVPANTTGLVLTKPNTETKAADGTTKVNNDGGNVTKVIHAVEGYRLVDDDADPMNWYLKKNEKESRGLFFYLFGIQFIWFFRYLRINDVRTFRFGRTDQGKEYGVMAKSQHSRFVFFSGQHDIEVKGIETEGNLKIDLLVNLVYEEIFPVRARLRTADPFAVMTLMVTQKVIAFCGGKNPNDIISDDDVKNKLIEQISTEIDAILDQLGIRIAKTTLADINFDEETRKLLEMKMKAEKEREKKIIDADAEMQARKKINDADADRIERVVKPAAENERTVSIRWAEAYERNETITTLATGAGATPMIPVGGGEKK